MYIDIAVFSLFWMFILQLLSKITIILSELTEPNIQKVVNCKVLYKAQKKKKFKLFNIFINFQLCQFQ